MLAANQSKQCSTIVPYLINENLSMLEAPLGIVGIRLSLCLQTDEQRRWRHFFVESTENKTTDGVRIVQFAANENPNCESRYYLPSVMGRDRTKCWKDVAFILRPFVTKTIIPKGRVSVCEAACTLHTLLGPHKSYF